MPHTHEQAISILIFYCFFVFFSFWRNFHLIIFIFNPYFKCNIMHSGFFALSEFVIVNTGHMAATIIGLYECNTCANIIMNVEYAFYMIRLGLFDFIFAKCCFPPIMPKYPALGNHFVSNYFRAPSPHVLYYFFHLFKFV